MKWKLYNLCMKKVFLLSLICLVMMACGSKKDASDSAEVPEKKVLVLYYSQTGATATVANEIKSALNADIEEVICEDPYDGDFGATIERSQKERENGELPVLQPITVDIQTYDVIFLGYPIWFGTYALPIAALLKEENFDGKVIVPFCTFGSGGLESSTRDLKAQLAQSEIKEGFGIRNARLKYTKEEVDDFLKRNGYLEGEVEELPEFEDQEELTEEDKAAYHEACDGYPFPMGTPTAVAKRTTAKGKEFRFTAQNQEGATSTVFVELRDEEGAKAEFTKVIR